MELTFFQFQISAKLGLLLVSLATVATGIFVRYRSHDFETVLDTQFLVTSLLVVSALAALIAAVSPIFLKKQLPIPFKVCFWLLILIIAGEVSLLTFLVSYSFDIRERFRNRISDKVYSGKLVDPEYISRNIDFWDSFLNIQTKFLCCSLDETAEEWQFGNPYIAQLVPTCCFDLVEPDDCSILQLRQNNTHQPCLGVLLGRFDDDLLISTSFMLLLFLTSVLNLGIDFREVTREPLKRFSIPLKMKM